MMPMLHAEEAMREAERIGVGMGRMPPATARRITRAWLTEANRDTHLQPVSPAALGGMGIGYQVIEKADGR